MRDGAKLVQCDPAKDDVVLVGEVDHVEDDVFPARALSFPELHWELNLPESRDRLASEAKERDA